MKAVVYLRISQDRSGEELGVDRQREDCLKLALQRGWEVALVLVENDTSATSSKQRPEWERMMQLVEAGEVQVVIGWTIDRVLRTGRDRLRLLDAGRDRGLTIALARGSDMDLRTPSGRLVADVLGASAQAEVDFKSDRQIRMHRQAAQQGRRIGGKRPFGYGQDGVTVVEDEAIAIRDAYDSYVQGVPLSRIAKLWNQGRLQWGRGTDNAVVVDWTHSAVRSVLRNPRYMGVRRHQPAKGAHVDYPAEWPALVSEATWRAAVALLDSAAAEFKPRAGRRLLTGIARCAVCERGIQAGGNKAGTASVYRCPSGKHVTRRGDLVDEVVITGLLMRLSRPEALKEVSALIDDGEAVSLTLEAEELRGEMDTIARERMQRVITPRQFSLMNADLIARLDIVERRMAATPSRSGLLEFVAAGVSRRAWDAIDSDRQRVLVAALMTVRLASGGRGVRVPPPETIDIAWKTDSVPV